MQLFNATVVPAKAVVGSAIEGSPYLVGMLTAKATFKFDARGRVELETQEPFPLLAEDQETPLGILPADSVPRRGERFEVMLLGQAHAPRGRSVTSLRVALGLGAVRREMLVTGDRRWLDESTISPPQSFERMPLIYQRSFGGSAAVQLDPASTFDVFDPVNRHGRGFDAREHARGLGQLLRAPAGFPALPDYQRLLPNLENPAAPITRWADAPEPVGWAPAYRDTAISYLHVIRREAQRLKELRAGAPPPDPAWNVPEAAPPDDPDDALYRAHSDWVIELPPPRATLRLENLLPDAPLLELELPQLRIIADYIVHDRTGERELRPQALVLLPDEKKMYLVYRMPFQVPPGSAHERAFRLRTETGWFTAARKNPDA